MDRCARHADAVTPLWYPRGRSRRKQWRHPACWPDCQPQRRVWGRSRDGRQANCLGCITQVGKLAEQFDFTSFADLAVGGWDVVPTKLGEALYQSRVLDYDLVRQVREDMDTLPVMRGVWDASFYGDSQAAGATHIAPETTRLEQLARLRADIRRFKSEEALDDKVAAPEVAGM